MSGRNSPGSRTRWYRVRLRDRFGADGQLERVAWLERVGRRQGGAEKNDNELAVLRAGLAQVIALIRETRMPRAKRAR